MQELMNKRLRPHEHTTDEEMKQAVDDYHLELEGPAGVDHELLQEIDAAADEYITKRVVPVVGHVPTKRLAGQWRWCFGNINGIATHKARNFKASQLQDITDTYDVNGYGFVEVGLDARLLKPSETIPTFLQIEGATRVSMSNNKYQPKISLAQQGGCTVIAKGEVCQYAKVPKGANDHRKLGRWSSMVLSSHPNQRIRIVTAYNVGKSKPDGLKTVYQQHLRYIQETGQRSSPRKLMRDDLLEQLRTWLRQGDRIMLFMDANENVIHGPLCSALALLGFTPEAHRLHGYIPNTHVSGSECIEEIWCSHGIEVTAIQILSFHKSIGDHRCFLVDFTTRSAIGLFAHLIIRPDCRRLTNSNESCVRRYLELVEGEWRYHKMNERLEQLTAQKKSFPVPDNYQNYLERIDKQMSEIFRFGEKNCRKITKIDGEYNLASKYWHEKMVSLKALERRLDGKTRNDGNICRTVRRHGIQRPRQLDKKQIKELYKAAYLRKKTIKTQGKFLRKQMLREKRARAAAKNDTKKANDLSAMMLRENDRFMWKRIKRVTCPPHTGALMRVEREIDGEIVEFTEEDDLVSNIMDELQDRFSGAEDAPISNCSITEELGDLGMTELGLKIISGEFEAPEDMRESTVRLLTAIGEIGREHKDDDVDIDMTEDNFNQIWRGAKEKTSSSMSQQHFGHYIACTKSKLLSKGMAMKLNLHSKWGSPPDRWLNVLMVMLEKKLGVVLIPKLRAILLKEADGNSLDGHVFGGRALTHARECGLIPEEQLAEKEKTSDDGVFGRVLKADYSRLRRQPIGIVAADAANCYDMVNHIVLSLILMALGIPPGPIVCMLSTIRFMRYYLRTGFGESKTYMGSDSATKRRHGLNQGSRAAPPCWTIVSSLLVRIQRARGHLATVISPISKLISTIAGYLYVDDTDLYILNPAILTKIDLVRAAQEATDDWGWHLIDTGGGCKAVKSFGHLVDYEFDDCGQWHCESVVEGFSLSVPTLHGPEEIELCKADEGKETLGVFTAPDGNSQSHLAKIKDKTKTWIARVQNGRLPSALNWISYIHQLWTGIRYGIGALPADRTEISGFLDDTNRETLPLLGVNRNITTGWRTLHRSYLGVGLFNFEVEMNIQRINLFLQQFDSPFDIGVTLRATMELVQLEVGLMDCPLSHPFEPFGRVATHCWFRSFWEAMDYYGCTIRLDYPSIQIPRERDFLLLELFKRSGWGIEYYVSWNRCRIACKALFLSDIVTACGYFIDSRFLTAAILDDPPLSAYDFGREQPCEADWEVWREFWKEFTNSGYRLRVALGPWICSSHRPNEWYYHPSSDTLFRRTAGGGQFYSRDRKNTGRSRSQQRFHLVGPASSIPDFSAYKMVGAERVDENCVILGAIGPDRYEPPAIQHDLFSLIRSWGGEWMWEQIQVHGQLDSVVAAYRNGTAIWCTDGSYDRVVMPDISSAGWTIFDPLTKHHIRGNFFEVSGDSASAYRGELLGLTALHLLACAFRELYGEPDKRNKLICDNEKALWKSKVSRRRISPATSHADLLRLLRNIKPLIKSTFSYVHVYGHADDRIPFKDLSLEQQLNIFCDHLAKAARWRSIGQERDISSQTLPREKAAIFLSRVKQTSDISKPMRFVLGRREAKEFYTKELKWTPEQFEEVDWESLDKTLEKKKIMYSLWLSKQASKFCGTRIQVARMAPGSDDRCPNCLRPEERALHLNLCPDPLRTRQFRESVAALQKWLDNTPTHPEIAFWIPKYLLARDRVKFMDLPSFAPSTAGLYMSSQMKAIAIGQDKIGWIHFLEGKVTGHIRALQQHYLRHHRARINGSDWIKLFLTKVIEISHTQWIFRNLTLHDKQRGHLAMLRREELAEEMDRLQSMDPTEVPTESQFLLHFDIDDLAEGDIANQEHWILAMRAARIAGMRVRGRQARRAKQPRRLRRRHAPPMRVFQQHTLSSVLREEVFGDIEPTVNKRPSDTVLSLLEPSNKRRRRRRKTEDGLSSNS